MKKVVIVLIVLAIGVSTVLYLAEKWVETNFERILNQKEDRTYNIGFEDVTILPFFKGLRLENMDIAPINIRDSASYIHGTVSYGRIGGISWRDLYFGNKADVRSVTFVEPRFDIYVSSHPAHKKKTGTNVQQLFGDILSRGEIHSFELDNGTIQAWDADNKDKQLGFIYNINFEASQIETDSLQWKYPIPFKVGDFEASLDSLMVYTDSNTVARCGPIRYETERSSLTLEHISMSYRKSWVQVARESGKQVDMIEFFLDKLHISDIGAQSNFYGDIDVRAGTILVDGLDMMDHRDKNLPRPPDAEKPMFNGMVDSIPFTLNVDSVVIRNSNVSYSEIAPEKSSPGTVTFANINGSITDVTTLPDVQEEYVMFQANLTASLNGRAPLSLKLEVPYESESFRLHAELTSMQMPSLNETLTPMMGVEATSGTISKLDFKMEAFRTVAECEMICDYSDLHIDVLKANSVDHENNKMLSLLAKSAFRKSNLPDEKHYRTAHYGSERNIYRGPFNFIWSAIKDGFLLIMPSGTVRFFMANDSIEIKDPTPTKEEKKAERHARKEHKKEEKAAKKKNKN